MSALRAIISVALLIGVVAWIGHEYGIGTVAGDLSHLSALTVGAVIVALIANALMAALRFKLMTGSSGHPIGFGTAMAAVGAGSLGGAVFFQIAGQLMSRSAVMRRGGVPYGAVVVVTLYERLIAAAIAGSLAVLGAVYIFGRVYLDQAAGGEELLKIVAGLVAAAVGGAVLGYGEMVRRNIAPLLTRNVLMTLIRDGALSLLVQIPMMIAYAVVAHELSPETPLVNLVAALAVVMFAASVPISLGGWGVREMSAVVTLGAVGMSTTTALTTAIIIGAGSLLAMAMIYGLSFGVRQSPAAATTSENRTALDYTRALMWSVPLCAAVLVLFQVYVPIGSGPLNVNLADPFALLGGALFVIGSIEARSLPRWRVGGLNRFVAAATAIIALSLLVGVARFGWTDWALINRFAGWFVVLCFAATGALLARHGGARAFRIVCLTYLGASIGIMLLDESLKVISAFGISLPDTLIGMAQIEGFAQNRNAFAFQVVMGLPIALVLLRDRRMRHAVLSIILVALWWSGSRAGWIASAAMIAFALYLGKLTFRDILVPLAFAVAAVLSVAVVSRYVSGAGAIYAPDILPEASSSAERLQSMAGGISLFLQYPLFGGGLGAFRESVLSAGKPALIIHSSFVWLLAELGLVGLLAFVLPALGLWRAEWPRARTDAVAAVLLLSLLGFALMCGPADMLYQRTFWLLIGAGLAIQRSSAGVNAEPELKLVRTTSVEARRSTEKPNVAHEPVHALDGSPPDEVPSYGRVAGSSRRR